MKLTTMRLEEFTTVFNGNYTEEQKRNYLMMYGDDKEQWPDTDDKARVSINLDSILGFNEIDEDNTTNVYLATGRSFIITTPYDVFKQIMQSV